MDGETGAKILLITLQITKLHHVGDFLLLRPCLPHSWTDLLALIPWKMSARSHLFLEVRFVFKIELQFQTQVTQEEPPCCCWPSPESHGLGWDQALISASGFISQGLNSCIHNSSNIQIQDPLCPIFSGIRILGPAAYLPISYLYPHMHLYGHISCTGYTVLQ